MPRRLCTSRVFWPLGLAHRLILQLLSRRFEHRGFRSRWGFEEHVASVDQYLLDKIRAQVLRELHRYSSHLRLRTQFAVVPCLGDLSAEERLIRGRKVLHQREAEHREGRHDAVRIKARQLVGTHHL